MLHAHSTYWLLLIVLGFSSCFYDNKEDYYDYQVVAGSEAPCDFTSVSFASDILPVVAIQCNGACHNANDRLGNVVLETHNNITPYINDGSFIGSINHTGSFAVMPPGGQKIPACNIQKIEAWIQAGAPNN